ncbi:hypothetical protein GCM10009787_42150 [Streptomyces bangladeshensis]|uniref:Cytochrome c domain-containing protein n=1 Tax=Streptomyces bangladeshensis TaxID=295352 RepID=A0ABP5NGD4_9ACTN
MGLCVRAGLAAGPAGGAAPAAAAPGRAEGALLGRRREVLLSGPGMLRPVLRYCRDCHADNGTQAAGKGSVRIPYAPPCVTARDGTPYPSLTERQGARDGHTGWG